MFNAMCNLNYQTNCIILRTWIIISSLGLTQTKALLKKQPVLWGEVVAELCWN